LRGEPHFIEEYDVYHDESLVAGYWHGILLVPRSSRQRLLSLLENVRSFTGYSEPVSLKKLDTLSGKVCRTIRCWLHIGIAALIQNLKGERYPIFTGEDARTPGFDLLSEVIGARFILFRVRNGLGSLSYHLDWGGKVETTFRIAFKGGLALFANDGDVLSIRSLHFDGHEHYHRRVDVLRILGRIGKPPDGVVLSDEMEVDDRTSDHRKANCQTHDDCQLLQLTDVFVGGFRTVLGLSTSDAQAEMCRPLLELADRWNRGHARMKNSKWFRGFCLSEGYLENGVWQFAVPARPAKYEQSTFFEK